MKRIQTDKNILKKWCVEHMDVHTDWTGIRVETKNGCISVDEFVNKLWNYLEEASDRMD